MTTEFTPLASFGGGMLIGLAAVLLMALHGRILGVTGILSGLLRGEGPVSDRLFRTALVTGMILAPLLVLTISGTPATIMVPVSTLALIIGGVLVGIGTSYGSGCSSGHGVCGNARFSRRSAVATGTFMATAMLTVFVTRHLMGTI